MTAVWLISAGVVVGATVGLVVVCLLAIGAGWKAARPRLIEDVPETPDDLMDVWDAVNDAEVSQ